MHVSGTSCSCCEKKLLQEVKERKDKRCVGKYRNDKKTELRMWYLSLAKKSKGREIALDRNNSEM